MARQLHKIWVLFCLLLLPCMMQGADNKTFTLVIDAGHGGHDAGAIGTYSKEKNINLNVALKVGELIEKNCPDVKVIFTRKTDVFVDLQERAAIANRAKADLFISIHTNAVENGNTVTGSETYSLGMARSAENLNVAKRENSVILYENDYQKHYSGFNPKSSESYIIFEFMQDQYMKQSALLAKNIQEEYSQAGRANKGVKQAGFLVLRATSMPSVLTELGFITTPAEEQYLNSAQGTDELAHSIYKGFVDYKNGVTRSQSVVLSNAGQTESKADTSPFIEQGNSQKAKNSEPEKQEVKKSNKEKPDVEIIEHSTPETTKVAPKIAIREKAEPTENPVAKNNENASVVYKIQFLTSSRMLRPGSQQFKGLDNVEYYMDKNMYKYTYGSTTNYKDILTQRKTLAEKFPDCFVIAMKGTERISISEAQEELKKK